MEKKIPADLIVLAMGGKADETFFFEAGEEHLAKEIYNIGDSSRQEEFWRQYAVHIILQCGFSGKEEKV